MTGDHHAKNNSLQTNVHIANGKQL